MEKDDVLTLTELIDIKTLQRIQDDFSEMTGMASLIIDDEGQVVTKGANFAELCGGIIRKSSIGCERCSKCDRMGLQIAVEAGKPALYTCHAGLTNFAIPIMAGDRPVG